MNTYSICNKEGAIRQFVKGTALDFNDFAVCVIHEGKTVAVIPFSSGCFVVIHEQ